MQIQLQDVSAVIHGTSRYNGGLYDTVYVQTLLVTNEAIPMDETWYVPTGASVPQAVMDFFQISGLDMSPKKASTILQGAEDIAQQSENENLPGVMEDAARYMLRAIMKKAPLIPISGATNTYLLSYDYKLYPLKDQPNHFEFNITVPFDGLELVAGRVQLSILTPINATIDPTLTKGIADDGQEIIEHVAPVGDANRNVVSFGYQRDPKFTIHYQY
ncbi:hypothetical protein HGO21_09520 [Acinetobacter sp. CUI P1]|nr:hypothetical protein [Acinetobacter sp. CUI P1]